MLSWECCIYILTSNTLKTIHGRRRCSSTRERRCVERTTDSRIRPKSTYEASERATMIVRWWRISRLNKWKIRGKFTLRLIRLGDISEVKLFNLHGNKIKLIDQIKTRREVIWWEYVCTAWLVSLANICPRQFRLQLIILSLQTSNTRSLFIVCC